MKRRRHTPEQIVRKLREADRLQSEGKGLAEVLRVLEVSGQALHRWRTQFGGGMKAEGAKRAQSAAESTKAAPRPQQRAW